MRGKLHELEGAPVLKFIRRLLGKDGPQDDSLTTTPLSDEQLEVAKQGVPRLDPPQLIVGSARSVGMQREHNEDSLFSFSASIGSDKSSMPLGIFIIADGMGGHQYGEVASEVALRAMAKHLIEKIYKPVFDVVPEMPTEPLREIMQQGVEKAHKAVLQQAPGGGTTLTTVVVVNNRMTIAHVGDSRAYAVYLDGRMEALTRDHSLVKRLEELGQITPEEAEIHPQKNVLYRALGQGELFEADISTAPLPRPGYILICSDGLWGLVSDDEMFRVISNSPNPQRASQSLVEAANSAGGYDNITAILVRMPD